MIFPQMWKGLKKTRVIQWGRLTHTHANRRTAAVFCPQRNSFFVVAVVFFVLVPGEVHGSARTVAARAGVGVGGDFAEERGFEKLCGDVPRIELFARTAAPGWDCWGNQAADDYNASQDKYDVKYLRYWVDEAQGTIFCLAEAPSAAAAATVHREAHGLEAQEIFEVKEGS